MTENWEKKDGGKIQDEDDYEPMIFHAARDYISHLVRNGEATVE